MEALGLQKGTSGLVITTLYRNGPAHKAGVAPGDVLVGIDGKPASDAREVLLAISGHRPGDRIRLEVLREGKRLELQATAGERPASLPARGRR
ncbi:MAG: PDZ domain-containing protein [Chromatiales bacterium]|nr:PDZ domain-containing protein [Chromatiales bacterium]